VKTFINKEGNITATRSPSCIQYAEEERDRHVHAKIYGRQRILTSRPGGKRTPAEKEAVGKQVFLTRSRIWRVRKTFESPLYVRKRKRGNCNAICKRPKGKKSITGSRGDRLAIREGEETGRGQSKQFVETENERAEPAAQNETPSNPLRTGKSGKAPR